jgi:hypothetical protein
MWNDLTVKNHGFVNVEEFGKFMAFSNSYLGIMKHYETSILRRKMVLSFGPEIQKSIIFSGNFEKIGLVNVNLVNVKKP